MEQVDVLARVIHNCQKVDKDRGVLRRAWVIGGAAADRVCQKVDILIETDASLGRKLDFLVEAVRDGLEGRVEVAVVRRSSQTEGRPSGSLIWRSRRV